MAVIFIWACICDDSTWCFFLFFFCFLQVISYSICLKISELIFMSTIVSYSLFITFHKMSYHYQMIWFSYNLRKWYDGKWNCTVIKTQIIIVETFFSFWGSLPCQFFNSLLTLFRGYSSVFNGFFGDSFRWRFSLLLSTTGSTSIITADW